MWSNSDEKYVRYHSLKISELLFYGAAILNIKRVFDVIKD